MLRKCAGILAILILFTNLAGASGAQASTIPGGPYAPRPIHPGPTEPLHRPQTPAPDSSDGAIHAQTIALGKPGTTFRYDKTFGVATQGYLQDDNHVYGVTGMTTDAAGNLYTVEENAARLVKYAPDGSILHQVGGASFHEWDAVHLNFPRDVALNADGDVFVADENGIIKFNPDLEFQWSYPETWWDSSDGPNMYELRGIVFDTEGYMYVADSSRHVINVYAFDGTGWPVYQTSIGQIDNSGVAMDQFNRPTQLALDSSNNLYVADTENHRVQKCEPNLDFSAWTCETFFGDSDLLGYGYALAFNPAKTLLYVTDNSNGRIYACPLTGGDDCSLWIPSGLNWPTALAFSPDGATIYVSLYHNFYIKVYDVFGQDNGVFVGTPNEPYLTDTNHFNGPHGVDVDAKGSLYVIERWGQRMLKYDAAGKLLWSFGQPGIKAWETNKATLMDSPVALAVDPKGQRVFVANENCYIYIYSALTGQYQSTFGDGCGTGNRQFSGPRGLAFDPAGNLYVSDSDNQRVMMYDKNLNFVRRLGTTRYTSRANDNFSWPSGIATDKVGALYVADTNNCRVQKFDKTGKFLMSFGTARCGREFDRMSSPTDVSVDKLGRVYVSEEWNHRVTVYAPTGAYLTTIAGAWGQGSGEMRRPMGVAVDPKGIVYVADWRNNRVQKFLPGVPYAAQINLNGFGAINQTVVFSLSYFKNQLYAGTWNDMDGAQIWRQVGTTWQKVVDRGFGGGEVSIVNSLLEYKGYLYAATTPAKLFRTRDGETWEIVTEDDFGLGVLNDFTFLETMSAGTKLCVRGNDWSGSNGFEIFCSLSGDADTWERLFTSGGLGNPNNAAAPAWIEYKNALYLGFFNSSEGGSVWRVENNTPVDITPPGLDPDIVGFQDFAVFNGFLYAGTIHSGPDVVDPADQHGSSLYRCALCDGSDWTLVEANGFGNVNNLSLGAFAVLKNALYALIENPVDGLFIYKTTDGLTWKPFIQPGLGSSLNWASAWNNAFLATKTNLLLGTNNQTVGGGLWKICPTTATCR